MSSPPPLAVIRDLVVAHGDQFRLEAPYLDIGGGDIVAIVGANGSGKTTFIESMLGLRARRQGEVTVLGTDVQNLRRDRDKLRALGCQLQHSAYARYMRVFEVVALHRAMYGDIDKEVGHRLGIPELYRRQYSHLSRGEKQRVDLFVAMAHRPRFMVLDEPGTGLDRRYIEALAQLLSNSDAAVVMASHDPAEVEMANRLIILSDGKIVRQLQMPADIRRTFGSRRYKIRFRSPLLRAQAQHAFSAMPETACLIQDDDNSLQLFSDIENREEVLSPYTEQDIESFSYSDVGARDVLEATSRSAVAR